MSKLVLITPTRNRSKAFAMAEDYVARQTVKPKRWIVVNDGTERYDYRMGQEVILRDTSQDDPAHHSITYNYLAALERCQGEERFACWEDDDWYRADYLERMDEALTLAPLVGFAPAYYYHVRARRWRSMKNTEHCSLASTGFTAEVLEAFRVGCRQKTPYVDMFLWCHWPKTLEGASLILPNDIKRPVMVGIKGLPFGCHGIGLGHDPAPGFPDAHGLQLRRWVGNDWLRYRR